MAEVALVLVLHGTRSIICQFGAGFVFASRQFANAQESTPATRHLMPDAVAPDVLVFDWWPRNEDRHLTENGGNPNLFWDVVGSPLAVTDHNLAFDPDLTRQTVSKVMCS